MIYHHQLRVRNPSSFQIFDLRCELEKPAYFHSKKINVNAVFFSLAQETITKVITKVISKLFVILCKFFLMYFYGINMPNMTLFDRKNIFDRYF